MYKITCGGGGGYLLFRNTSTLHGSNEERDLYYLQLNLQDVNASGIVELGENTT